MTSPVEVWRRQKIDRIHLGKEGIILSWTEIFVTPPEFESQTPYTVVMVQVSSGEKLYGALVDFSSEERKIGQKVRAVLRRNAEVLSEQVLEYGVKFIPIL